MEVNRAARFRAFVHAINAGLLMSMPRRTLLVRSVSAVLLGGALSAPAANADTTTYQYDALGRLARVDYANGRFIVYSYDAAGNRTVVTRSDGGTFTASLQVTGTGPANLRAIADAAGYTGAQHANIIFQVGAAVTLSGASNQYADAGPAIDTGTWPSNIFTIALALQVSGKAYGGGGAGAGGASGQQGVPGQKGGDAIYCRENLAVVVNAGGQVKAGGGGGGSGGSWARTFTDSEGQLETTWYESGAGGGGFPNGLAGVGNYSGNLGTQSGGGVGGAGGPSETFVNRLSGAGGTGGAAAAVGASGGAPSGSGGGGGGAAWSAGAAGTGGQPGYAIRKNGKSVSVTNNGVISGAQG